jgi:hypothetical protein
VRVELTSRGFAGFQLGTWQRWFISSTSSLSVLVRFMPLLVVTGKWEENGKRLRGTSLAWFLTSMPVEPVVTKCSSCASQNLCQT